LLCFCFAFLCYGKTSSLFLRVDFSAHKTPSHRKQMGVSCISTIPNDKTVRVNTDSFAITPRSDCLESTQKTSVSIEPITITAFATPVSPSSEVYQINPRVLAPVHTPTDDSANLGPTLSSINEGMITRSNVLTQANLIDHNLRCTETRRHRSMSSMSSISTISDSTAQDDVLKQIGDQLLSINITPRCDAPPSIRCGDGGEQDTEQLSEHTYKKYAPRLLPAKSGGSSHKRRKYSKVSSVTCSETPVPADFRPEDADSEEQEEVEDYDLDDDEYGDDEDCAQLAEIEEVDNETGTDDESLNLPNFPDVFYFKKQGGAHCPSMFNKHCKI